MKFLDGCFSALFKCGQLSCICQLFIGQHVSMRILFNLKIFFTKRKLRVEITISNSKKAFMIIVIFIKVNHRPCIVLVVCNVDCSEISDTTF